MEASKPEHRVSRRQLVQAIAAVGAGGSLLPGGLLAPSISLGVRRLEDGLTRGSPDEAKVDSRVVLDFVDAVIHLFEPATRAHYDLEMLWGDAATIGWERDADSE